MGAMDGVARLEPHNRSPSLFLKQITCLFRVKQIARIDWLDERKVEQGNWPAEKDFSLAAKTLDARMAGVSGAVHAFGLLLLVVPVLVVYLHGSQDLPLTVAQSDLVTELKRLGTLLVHCQGDRDRPGQTVGQQPFTNYRTVVR